MKKTDLSRAMAHLVMESVSSLQKTNRTASLNDIKTSIVEKYGERAGKFLNMVPKYLRKGLNLGLISKFGQNFRTSAYVANVNKKRLKRTRGLRRRTSVTFVEARRRRRSKSRRRRRRRR